MITYPCWCCSWLNVIILIICGLIKIRLLFFSWIVSQTMKFYTLSLSSCPCVLYVCVVPCRNLYFHANTKYIFVLFMYILIFKTVVMELTASQYTRKYAILSSISLHIYPPMVFSSWSSVQNVLNLGATGELRPERRTNICSRVWAFIIRMRICRDSCKDA